MMVTKSQVQAAARRKYGKSTDVCESHRYGTPKQRAEAKERQRQLRVSRDALTAKHKGLSLEKMARELVKASEFAVDTDGSKTAIECLRNASSTLAIYLAEVDDLRDWRKESDSLNCHALCKRWEIVRIDRMIPSFPVSVIEASGDTLDELMELVSTKSGAVA